jgi:uncharacterized metal-binding protein
MKTQPQCSCTTAPKLVFPCSGASDVGGLSDRTARQMTLDLAGKMYCLAGIGGRVEGIMANTKGAARVLVIDGCKEECARKTMELAGPRLLRQADRGGNEEARPISCEGGGGECLSQN